MSPNVTMQDIAVEAGVSIATVSRVLAGKTNVRPETAERIRSVVEKHHFRPNGMARSLYHRRSNTLAMVLPDLINPYYGRLFTTAENYAHQLGYSLELSHHPYGKSIGRHMTERMIERRLDGVILSCEYIDARPDSEEMKLLADVQAYMPVALIGNMRPVEGMRNLVIDLAGCMRQAVEYLYAIGHRKIALLGGRNDMDNPYSRIAGFCTAMQARGLSCENRIFTGGDSPEDGMRALYSALDCGDPPTALCCVNDLAAIGAVHAALTRGLRVPDDLSVLGCDNSFLCAYQPVPLTSIDIHVDEMARGSVALLMGDGEPETRVMTGELVARESCKPLA